MARKITITLTETQFLALAAAVSTQDVELEDQQNGDPGMFRERQVLDRAWTKIRDAWHRTTKNN